MFSFNNIKAMVIKAASFFVVALGAMAGADWLGFIESTTFATDLKVAAIAAVLSIVKPIFLKLSGKKIPAKTESIEEILKDAAKIYELLNKDEEKPAAKKKAAPKKKPTSSSDGGFPSDVA